MKKFVMLVLSAVLALSCAGCTAKITPSFAMPPSWKPGSAVYEKTTYRLNRYAVTSAEDRLNPQGTSVADGKLDITIRNCTDSAYPDCLELINEFELTFSADSYMPSGVAAKTGDYLRSTSKVIFSVGTSTVMETRYAEKKIISTADKTVNLDYTAQYGGGLRITSYELDDEGKRIAGADGAAKSTTYSFKAKKVPSNVYDNEQWMLLNRYGSEFKAGWSGSYSLVSIPEIIYNDGKLSTFQLSSTSTEETARNLTAMTDNIVLSPTDSFAEEDADGNFQVKCTDVSMANAGSMGVNRGPILYASFITTRKVDLPTELPLSNLMVQYAQNEYSTSGKMLYSTVARLVRADVTAS